MIYYICVCLKIIIYDAFFILGNIYHIIRERAKQLIMN